MQFGPTEDLESYPRDIEKDSKYVEELGGDLIFNPEPEEITGVHPFEGVPVERVPSTMNLDIYDEKFEVETNEAYRAAREVAKTDGILIGTSSGGAIYAATEIAKRPENKGKTIVAVLSDTGLRYLSTNLFNEEYHV